MNIGIFKEDFNPITKLHIDYIYQEIDKQNLDKVILIPSLQEKDVSRQVKLDMINLATKDIDKVKVIDNYLNFNSEIEIDEYISKEYYNDNIIDIAIKDNIEVWKVNVLIKLNLPFDSFVTSQVFEYIQEKGIYHNDKYYEYVCKVLPEKRRNHTYGVICQAVRYAKELGYIEEKAELAALLHDNAKYQKLSDYPEFLCPENVPEPVVHQFLGEYVARNVLNVEDEDILLAIKYHTTGRVGMTKLEKIIYLADLLEPSRTFNGVDELREAVDKNFEKGFARCVVELYNFINKDSDFVYYLTKELADSYMEEKI